MNLNEFNDYYLNELLHKLSSENKCIFLLDDFNVDLMKYGNHHSTNENFLTLYFHICFFLILHNQLELEILAKH